MFGHYNCIIIIMLTYHEKSKDHFLQCHAILLKGAKPIVRALAEDTRVSSLYSSAPLAGTCIYCTCTQMCII